LLLFLVTVTPFPDSKTALTSTDLLGILNVAVVDVELLIVTFWPPETNSHRTNLYPLLGVAVRVTFVFCAPPAGVAIAVPHALLFLITVTLFPASKTALTSTALFGILNVAVVDVELLIVTPWPPDTNSHLTNLYPLLGVAVRVTVAF